MKKFLSIVLAVAMMLTMVVPAFATSNFKDIDDSDYKIAIERLTALGIVNGRTATEYEPDGIVTRAEMAKLLVVSLGLKTGAAILENTSTFDDVPTTHWSVGYVNVAAQYGLIRGDGDGNFRPDDTVNYAEAVTMCIRALNYARVVDKAGEWPTNYLNKALELGLFDDVEFASAKDGANRGSIAQIIWNMVISPMWVVTQENEAEGIYYGKTGESMLDLKFTDYTVEEELIFNDWSYDIEKDEYVVNVTLSGDKYEYEGNDFYTYVPGTEVEALIYKDDKVISMYPTDDNYLVEGLAKDLADKYDAVKNARFNDGDYLYLLMDGSKSTSRIEDAVVINAYASEVITKVETKKDTLLISTIYNWNDSTARYDVEDIVEDGYLVVDGDNRYDVSALKEGNIITWVENDAESDEIILIDGTIKAGKFGGLEYSETKDGYKYAVEVGSKEYEYYNTAVFAEIEKDDDEVAYNLFEEDDFYDIWNEEEKDNDYVGVEATLYFDLFGRLIAVVFDEVETTENSGIYYLAVDGNVRTVATKTDSEDYITLANKDGQEAYKIADDANVDFVAGSMYVVEFNTKGEIKAAQELTAVDVEGQDVYFDEDENLVFGGKIDETDDDDLVRAYIAGTVDKDYGYIGRSSIKVVSSTVVFSIIPQLNDDDELNGKYALEVSTGKDALEGLRDFAVIVDADDINAGTIKAKYVIAIGDSESTEKNVGIVDSFATKLGKYTVTIDGKKYDIDDDPSAYVGDVVAYTLNDGEAKIVYSYKIDEIYDAGLVTKVDGALIYVDGVAMDLDYYKEMFKDNDYRVIEISLDYKKGEYSFGSVKEIEIDDISIAKKDLVAIDEVNGYFAIIDGFESLGN